MEIEVGAVRDYLRGALRPRAAPGEIISFVIPANAGDPRGNRRSLLPWTPAFAGVTGLY